MPDLPFVERVAQAIYQLKLRAIEALVPEQGAERGIYRIQDLRENAWVLRLVREPAGFGDFIATARLLDWLARQGFPAPTILPTSDGQLVGSVDGWAVMVLAYVDGAVLETHPPHLEQVAQLVGRLHTLGSDQELVFPTSRCHPDNIGLAASQLAANGAKLPSAFHPLAADLQAAMLALRRLERRELRVTHGDCWYRNAVRAADGWITLIDWDLAGMGLPLLELGNLLLTSHFDFSRPLDLNADEAIIRAIMRGYQAEHSLVTSDCENLVHALRFLLAFQLGSYITDDILLQHPEFPFVLQKLQARYDVTQAIAEIALQYAE
ncbi:MAG TPA: phosphotransferase [Roseiflexaceae bacterium]|nr:phosphotransferase [Roseiflexaceae bacterium]